MNPLLGETGTFLLFAYGTLRRGGVRHGVLSGQRCLGEAHTLPGYALYNLGSYPGLVKEGGGEQVVHGELYEVECRLVGHLDAVEGAPSLFAIGGIDISHHPGPVWAYYYQGDVSEHPRIESGKWEN